MGEGFDPTFNLQALLPQLAMQADPGPLLQFAQLGSLPGAQNPYMPGLSMGQGGIPADPNAAAPIPQQPPGGLSMADVIYGDMKNQGLSTTLPQKPAPTAAPLSPQQMAALQPAKPMEPKFAPGAAPQNMSRTINFQPIGLPQVPVGYQYPSLAQLLYGRR